jgi:hypothetical protein
MQYYIVDTTVRPLQDKRFSSYVDLVHYLEQMSLRESKQNRKQKMLELASIGYGYDDPDSVIFTRFMAERFNMGVIRETGTGPGKFRCDVSAIALFQKDEFGS